MTSAALVRDDVTIVEQDVSLRGQLARPAEIDQPAPRGLSDLGWLLLDEKELVAWIGDSTVFVRATSNLGRGPAHIKASDEAKFYT